MVEGENIKYYSEHSDYFFTCKIRMLYRKKAGVTLFKKEILTLLMS